MISQEIDMSIGLSLVYSNDILVIFFIFYRLVPKIYFPIPLL